MTLVMSTVSGGPGWFNPDTGAPSTGRVIMEVVQEVTTNHGIVPARTWFYSLVNGNIDPANNAIPAADGSVLQYRVTERIDGAANPDPYVVSATNGVLDLSSAPRTPATNPPMSTYVTAQGLAQALSGFSGGSGGAVASVFGRTGVVTANAGDYTPAQVGALAIANNLSDLNNAGTARGNLGLGTAATANKVAAGIAGVLDASDASTSNARTPTGAAGGGLTGTYPNPGVAYGTTAGTAAQGNDARITGAIQSGAASSGDVTGNLPGPLTVAKVNGVAVTGVPAAGQVLTATGPAAADWAPAPVTSVAGRGGAVTLAEADITNLVSDLAAKAPTARQLIAGTGLTGGGDLTADRSFAVAYGMAAATAAQGNDPRITGALQAANNLSDVPNAAAARNALAAQPLYVSAGTHTSAYAASVGQIVLCDTTAGSFTVTLPTGATFGQQVVVKLLNTTGTNSVTVACGGSDVINAAGTTTATLSLNGESFELTATGTGIWVLGSGQKGLSSLDARYITWISVKDQRYGAKGDGATVDRPAIQAAAAAVSAAGGGVCYFPGGTYVIDNPIVALSLVTFLGCGAASTITSTVTNSAIASQSATLHDVVVDSLAFNGPVTVTVTQPTVGRGTPGAGITYAVWMDGDLDPHATTPPTITNITIRNCTIRNCTQLPIWISGVRGRVMVTGNHFDNNKDLGFLWNQEVMCSLNRVINTADNGISASRGNTKMSIVGNTLENIAYAGIEIGGFVGDIGPRDVTCTGNVIKNAGLAGIFLDEAPYYANVSGNEIYQGYWRNATDQLSDTVGVGIWIRGAPHGTPTAPTDYATGLFVHGNLIRACARAGIYFNDLKFSVIERNIILDIGTQFHSDGVTAVSVGDTTQNIGILGEYPTTSSTVIVRDNVVIDTRATPYCNYAVQPVPATSGIYLHNNTMMGCRNGSNTTQTIYSDTLGLVAAWQENMPRWAATAMTSITLGSGVVRYACFIARRTETVTQVAMSTGNTAGTLCTLARMGLVSVDASGNATPMSTTASDTTLFSAAQTDYARTLAAPQQVVEGQLYAVEVIWVGTGTAPSIIGALAGTPSLNAQTPRLCGSLTGQSDLPVAAVAMSNSQSIPYGSVRQ